MTVEMGQSIRQNPAYRLVAHRNGPLQTFARGRLSTGELTTKTRMLQKYIRLTVLVGILSECASRTLTPDEIPSPQYPPTESTRLQPTTQSRELWQFTPREQTQQYRSTTYSIIHQTSEPLHRADTLTLNTHITVNLNHLHLPPTISGYIDSIEITGTNRSNLQISEPGAKVLFNGIISANNLIISSPNSQLQCASSANSILGEVRTVLGAIPLQFSRFSTWTDSVSATVCSGAQIPTTLKSIRSYRVIGEETYAGISALLIQRKDSTEFTGSGPQEQHQIQVRGLGKGTSQIYLDIETGIMIAVVTTQKTQLIIKSSGWERHFTQDVSQKVKQIP